MRPEAVDLKYFRNERYGYSMVYPEPWRVDPTEMGAIFTESEGTFLAVEVQDLGTKVTAADLPALREGFLAGLRGTPNAELISSQDYDVGFLVGLEAHQRIGRARRWVRVLYKESLQVRLIAQGRTEAEYERWLSCFKPAMTAFQFDGGQPPLDPNRV